MIYLDYAANTPVDAAVLARFSETERRFFGNANARHRAGREAAAELDRITEAIAAQLHVAPAEVLYTSGASESNNTALLGLTQAAGTVGRHILTTPLEHASVSGCLDTLQKRGYEVELLDVDRNGRVNLDRLSEQLRPDTVLCAVTAVDSELGTVQPIEEIARIVRAFSHCRLHVDATQAVGKIPFSFDQPDTVSLTAHKFYGLNGSGLLLKKRNVPMTPLIHGGTSTTPYRSGTPTVGLCAALETALSTALSQLETRTQAVRKQAAALRSFLTAYPNVQFNSPDTAVPHILNLSVAGVKGTTFQRALDEKGVCVSVKSACSSDGAPSKAVMAVTRDRYRALSSFRISLSHLTTDAQRQAFQKIFDTVYRELTV